jgi:hypothetical protein
LSFLPVALVITIARLSAFPDLEKLRPLGSDTKIVAIDARAARLCPMRLGQCQILCDGARDRWSPAVSRSADVPVGVGARAVHAGPMWLAN